MKKILTALLTLFLAFSFISCDDLSEWLEEDETEEPAEGEENTEDDSPEEDDTDDEDEDDPLTDLSTSPLRNSIIALAREQLGTPYYYGGTSPSTGFDCSGFVYYCYTENGVTLPRTSRDQYANGTDVTLTEAKFGDIVAFYSPVSHVGMITSSTTFIHSPRTGEVVKEVEFAGYWENQMTGIVSYIDN